MTMTASESFLKEIEDTRYIEHTLSPEVGFPVIFCPFCEAVVDHSGCDCGQYLPTYDRTPEEEL